MKKNNKKGFTIVELVIVIAVIAILTAVLIPTFTSATEKAKVSAALQNARNEYNLYAAALLDDETKDDTFYISSGEYWFEVVKGEINATPINEPTNYKGAKDLSAKTGGKSFTTPPDITDDYEPPISLDENYYTDDELNNVIAEENFEPNKKYYYIDYIVENQNADVKIYAKVN